VLVTGGGGNPQTSEGWRVQRQELFISYSRKDRAFLEQFWTHLKPLETLYGLQRWDDSRIKPGAIWLEEIEQALSRAQVALLLVSPDFLASDFIQRKELPALFNAAKQDGLKILWLPIRPCSWKRHRQIEQYQSVGSLDPTLAEMDEVKRDRAMVSITDHIHDLFDRIQAERLARAETADAEALAQSQEQERWLTEQEAQRQREENARLERLKAGSEARAEAVRWKAEAGQLAREKEEWQKQATSAFPQPTDEHKFSDLQACTLIKLPANRAWLVQEGKEWRKQEAMITVPGYKEELAGDVAITMIEIPAGEFLMGSSTYESGSRTNERPRHKVSLRSYFLGQTPVTQDQWEVVASWAKVKMDLKLSPSFYKGANRPVESVSWHQAMEFCRRLSIRAGREYVLPNEAQWEYACRAGTTSLFSFGDTLTPEVAKYCRPMDCFRWKWKTTDVSSFPANQWGLYDMHGNVCEWCLDPWRGSYHGASADVSVFALGEGSGRVLRGGSWARLRRGCRSAFRLCCSARGRSSEIGFRVCRLPED
jgi:formylglycine-generating enzyme required for sulfatase activity